MTLKPRKKRGRSGWSALPEIKVIDVEHNRWDRHSEDEWLWWPRVMWIDPGTVSGVAMMWFDPRTIFQDEQPIARALLAYSEIFLSGPENGINGQVNRYLRFMRTLGAEPGLAAGIESFVPRQLNMDWEFLAPVRIRAALEYQLSRREEKLTEHLLIQQPVEALTAFNNHRLQNLGLYTPGPDHINDAKRHCLLHIRKLRDRGVAWFQEHHGNEMGWWE